MKKLLAATTVALTLTAGLTACGSDDEGDSVVRFGYIGDYNGTSLLAIAEEQGLWEEHDLEVETTVFNDGPTQIQALGSGDLDYGYIGPGAVWLPASDRAKIIAVNTLGGADRVIAQPGITSLEDLRGTSIGVPQGTSGDMILQLALESAGLTTDDVELVPMDPPTIVSAFGAGQIDAAGIFYPLVDTMKEQVPDLVELAQNSDFEDEFSFPTAFVAGNEVVDKDADQTKEVVAVLREAMDYREANPEETVELTAAMLDQPVETVAADASHNEVLTSADLDGLTEDGSVDGWYAALGEFFVGTGQLEESVEPSSFYLGDDFVAAGE